MAASVLGVETISVEVFSLPGPRRGIAGALRALGFLKQVAPPTLFLPNLWDCGRSLLQGTEPMARQCPKLLFLPFRVIQDRACGIFPQIKL